MQVLILFYKPFEIFGSEIDKYFIKGHITLGVKTHLHLENTWKISFKKKIKNTSCRLPKVYATCHGADKW